MRFMVMAAAAATLVVIPTVAPAAVLYDRPLALASGGGIFSSDAQRVVDRFSLSSGGKITSVKWFGSSFRDEPFTAFAARFYDISGNQPNFLLQGTAGVANAANTNLIDAYGKAVFEFTLSIPAFNAAAGVEYFFGIADLTQNGNFIWERGVGSCCAVVSENGGPFIPDSSGRTSFAFSLHGDAALIAAVPEPATWAMILLGFGLIGAAIRRQKVIVRVSHAA